MNMEPNKRPIEVQVNLQDLSVMAHTSAPVEPPFTESKASSIVRELREKLSGMNSRKIEISTFAQAGQHRAAFEVLDQNREIVYLVNDLLNTLLGIDLSVLTSVELKSFLEVLIFVASRERKFMQIEGIVDRYLADFSTDLTAERKANLILMKANAALQDDRPTSASEYFNQVLNMDGTSALDKAYSYRGLAFISVDSGIASQYRQRAVDKFLEAGNKREAVADLMYMANASPANLAKYVELIDQAIAIHDKENVTEREELASLYHTKAVQMRSMGAYQEALQCVEMACSFRENTVGNEHQRYSSFSLALLLAEAMNEEGKAQIYQKKVNELVTAIETDEFKWQQIIKEKWAKGEKFDASFVDAVLDSPYLFIRFALHVAIGGIESYSFVERIDSMDKAKKLLRNPYFKDKDHAVFHFTFAEIFRINGRTLDAVREYENCLSFEPLHWKAIHHAGEIFSTGQYWAEAKAFYFNRLVALGEDPGLLFAYARAIYELGENQAAFACFHKLVGSTLAPEAEQYIKLILNRDASIQLSGSHLEKYPFPAPPILLPEFMAALEGFSKTVSTHSRMQFWTKKGGQYVWKPSPENLAKHQLITAMHMKFGDGAIETFQESVAGAGYIDLFIILRGGLKLVVELKMCGAGYSSTYALTGEDQLVHYLKNTGTHIGILVIFDGRKKEFGGGFKPVQGIGNLTIYSLNIDMRPTIRKRGDTG